MRDDKNKKNKKRVLLIVIMIIMIAVIVASAAILLNDGTDKGKGDSSFVKKVTEETSEKKAEAVTVSAKTGKEKATTEENKKTDKKAQTAKTAKKTDENSKAAVDSKTNGSDKSNKTTDNSSADKSTTERNTVDRKTTERSTEGTTAEKTTTEKATTERPTTEKATTERATTEKATQAPHQHTWKDVYETREKKVCVSEAWDEDVYKNQSFCSYCGKNIDGDSYHIFNCGKKYYSESLGEEIYEGSSEIIRPVKVDTIHHPAKYEIQTEKVFVGRQCSGCGEWQ